MSEETTTKAKRAPTEVETVTMQDGRNVDFAGKKTMIKTITPAEGGGVTVRFDFRNGETRSHTVVLNDPLLWDYVGHGLSQKAGDETAGIEKVEDKVIAVETILEQLSRGEWSATRESGDSFSGASIVIRAICEVSKKSSAEVKAFLQGKLDASKAAAEATGAKPLSRKALYDSFRRPGTEVAAVIERLERESAAKKAVVNADDLMGELTAG